MQASRILVVDDHEEGAAALAEGLRLHNYCVDVAHTGREALSRCAGGGIDLILLDICLPDVDGHEVCRRLKAAPATQDIPVVFVTVKGTREDIAAGYHLGAVDYITKPYNLPMVMIRVEAALRAYRMARRLHPEHDESFLDSVFTDHLTGLRNRRYLLERLEEEVAKAARCNYPVSCVALDVDEIEALDDELGVAPLDDLLVEIGIAFRNYSRTYDILARYDGTTFAVALPHSPLEQAVIYATKLMREVEATTFCDPCYPTLAKLSVGISALSKDSKGRSAELILGEAMQALLNAKHKAGERLSVLAETA